MERLYLTMHQIKYNRERAKREITQLPKFKKNVIIEIIKDWLILNDSNPLDRPQQSRQFYRLENRPRTTFFLLTRVLWKNWVFKKIWSRQIFLVWLITGDSLSHFENQLIWKETKYFINWDSEPEDSFVRWESLTSSLRNPLNNCCL